jgi:hypothetical protein
MRANSRAHAAQAAFERQGALQTAVDRLPGNMARGTVFAEKGALFHTMSAMHTISRQITGFFKKIAPSSKGRPSGMMIRTGRHIAIGPFNGNRQRLLIKHRLAQSKRMSKTHAGQRRSVCCSEY